MSLQIRIPFLLVALWCIVAPAKAVAFLPGQNEAGNHIDRGFEFARQGKLENAETELRQAVKLAPRNLEALTTLATVLAMQQKLGESTHYFQKALQISPNDVTARRYLAANLWQLHRYREASDNLKIILRQKADDKGSRLLLGMVSETIGDYATAVRMLTSVPDEVQKQPQSIAALARSYYHLRQTEEARATLALMSSHSSGPQAVYLGAQIADEMQDYPTAERLFTSLRDTFPDRPRLEYSLALVAYHAGHIEQSTGILASLVESGARTAPVLNLLGWCYQKQGRGKDATQALEESIGLAPADEANYLDLGKIFLAQRSLPSALQTTRRTTMAFPNSAAAYELQGLVEKEMGQFTDAIRSYSKAVQLDTTRPDGILGLAQVQSAAGLSKDAGASFESGIQKFPKDVSLKVEYAGVLLRQSETGDLAAQTHAEQLLRSALALDRSLPAAHYQLGNLALKSGRMSEAQQHLERAVKLEPKNAQTHFALARAYRRLGRKEDAEHEMELYEKLKAES